MIIGDDTLGVASIKYKDLKTSITCIYAYPFKIILEHLEKEKCYQISISIFKIKTGIFFQY